MTEPSSPDIADIVPRLRHLAKLLGVGHFDIPARLNEAADEIERLRDAAATPGKQTARAKAMLECIIEWMREPDREEEFSLADFTDWINRRPLQEVYSFAAEPIPGAAATPVAWRWRHPNWPDNSWNYQTAPIVDADPALTIEPLFTGAAQAANIPMIAPDQVSTTTSP